MRDGPCRRSILRAGGLVAAGVAGCLRLEQEGNGRQGEEATEDQRDAAIWFQESIAESQQRYRTAVDDGIDLLYEAIETSEWVRGLENADAILDVFEEARTLSVEARDIADRIDGEFGAAAHRWAEIWLDVVEGNAQVVELLLQICQLGREHDESDRMSPERFDELRTELTDRVEDVYTTLEERRERLHRAVEETTDLDETVDEWDVPRIDIRDPPEVQADGTGRDAESTFETRFWEAMERSTEHLTAASERTHRAIDASDAEAWAACHEASDEAHEELTFARRTAHEAGEIAAEADRDAHVSAVEDAIDLYALKNELLRDVRELCSAGEAGNETEVRRYRERVDELLDEVAERERELERTLSEL